MRRSPAWARLWTALVVVLLLLAPAWAEYCRTQGSPRIPKGEVWRFDWRAFLDGEEIVASEARHLPWGTPACSRLLFHKEYVLCYDLDRKVAGWASYRLERKDVTTGERWNAFRSDPRLPSDQNPRCDDYSGSGFDRGHLVPRSDMNRTKTAVVNTFFLTNMSPQHPNVNQGVWERLERLARAWARASGWVHIIAGAVFDHDDNRQPDSLGQEPRTKPGSDIGVPSHFYKIVIRQRADGALEAITVLVPNRQQGVPGRNSTDAARDTFLRGHITFARDVRERVGIDLLPNMPGMQKEQLESAVASDLWPTN